MTDSDITTPCRLPELLEVELDKAVASLNRFQEEHPGDDVDDEVARINAIVRCIETLTPQTLGDIRIQAKALDAFYCCDIDAGVFDLLQVLEQLPQRLWEERL